MGEASSRHGGRNLLSPSAWGRRPSTLTVRLLETPFAGYLTLRRFQVDEDTVDVLSGPGHDIVVMVGVVPSPERKPTFVIKNGDTRPARALRKQRYVKDGLVAGRLDYDASPETIAKAEVEEEVAGTVRGAVLSLGELPVPTMPSVSTEADLLFLSIVDLDPTRQPKGDGGRTEVSELLGWELLDWATLLRRVRRHRMSETFRARVAYGRAHEKLGLGPAVPRIPLDPSRTLGLGPVVDLIGSGEEPPSPQRRRRPKDNLRSRINGARVDVRREIRTRYPPGRLLDAKAVHLADGKPASEPFSSQILDLIHDEIEVIPYAVDDDGITWVQLYVVRWPALAAKERLQNEVRSGRVTPPQLWSGKVTRARRAKTAARNLCQAEGWGAPELLLSGHASPGQCARGEFVYAAPAPGPDLLRIDEALRRAREEGVSSRTEAGLLELAARK